MINRMYMYVCTFMYMYIHILYIIYNMCTQYNTTLGVYPINEMF